MKNLTPCSTDAAQPLAHVTCSIALLLEVQPSFKLQNDRTFYSHALYIARFYALYLNNEAKLMSDAFDVARLESYTMPACKGGCIKAAQKKVEVKCSGEWRRRWSQHIETQATATAALQNTKREMHKQRRSQKGSKRACVTGIE